jgi:hypothetical protein
LPDDSLLILRMLSDASHAPLLGDSGILFALTRQPDLRPAGADVPGAASRPCCCGAVLISGQFQSLTRPARRRLARHAHVSRVSGPVCAAFRWPAIDPFRKGTRVINIIIGLVMVIGGLSGKLALKGTHSGGALAVLGGALIAWGVLRMTVWKKNEG